MNNNTKNILYTFHFTSTSSKKKVKYFIHHHILDLISLTLLETLSREALISIMRFFSNSTKVTYARMESLILFSALVISSFI